MTVEKTPMRIERPAAHVIRTVLPGRPPFTVADLLRFPDDGNRYELFEGSLLVSPPPTPVHQLVVMRLVRFLEDAGGPDLAPVPRINLRVGKADFLVPDVAVVPSGLAAGTEAAFAPRDVVLAVEVVSPHTRRRDRVMKPSAYADARIPFYWRVEPAEGPAVYVHELDGESYRLVRRCEAGQVATVTAPFRMSFDPAELARPRA